MKKLTNLKTIVVLFSALLFLGLSSCTKDNPTDPTNSPVLSDSYVSYGTQVDDLTVSDATIENDIQITNDMQPHVMENGAFLGGKMPMFDFRGIFKKMQLTEDQLATIKTYMDEHRDCERTARQAYFQEVAKILGAANLERRAIVQKVKNGEITRAEANQLIKALNIRTREAIQNSNANQDLRAALKNCMEELITNIKSQLTEDQLTLFNQWLQKIKP